MIMTGSSRDICGATWIVACQATAAHRHYHVALAKFTNRLSPRSDGIGACASALSIAWWMIAVLLVLDPHLFLRGSGDLFFTLIGIVTGRALNGKRHNESV